MRARILSEYVKRQFACLMVPLGVIMGLSFILEFVFHPIELVSYERDMISLFTKGMLPLILLFVKAGFGLIPLFVAWTVISRVGSRLANELYDVEDAKKEKRQPLYRSLFGGLPDVENPENVPDADAYDDIFERSLLGMTGIALRPLIVIGDGRFIVGAGSNCDRVGGPGFIVVHNDTAVVLEQGGRLTRVLSGHLGLLERFERVWAIIDLRQQRWVLPVSAMTKDGIDITCEADITFKIDDRFIDENGKVRAVPVVAAPGPRSPDDEALEKALKASGIGKPYPHTREAVFRAATSIWVRARQPEHDEQLRQWTGRVMIGEVEGALRSILAQYRLDWLIRTPEPEEEDLKTTDEMEPQSPRDEIRRQLRDKLRDTFGVDNPIGARILKADLGQIDVKSEKIPSQWIDVWKAAWDQRAMESLAEGGADLARMEADQLQAQAEMALLLTESIRPLIADVEDSPPYLFAMRLVQTLRWMAYDPWRRHFVSPAVLRSLDELEVSLNQFQPGGQLPAGQRSEDESALQLPWRMMEGGE
jgi:regulator of protease activity HflC (stomatin/prohibitin superfamily)